MATQKTTFFVTDLSSVGALESQSTTLSLSEPNTIIDNKLNDNIRNATTVSSKEPREETKKLYGNSELFFKSATTVVAVGFSATRLLKAFDNIQLSTNGWDTVSTVLNTISAGLGTAAIAGFATPIPFDGLILSALALSVATADLFTADFSRRTNLDRASQYHANTRGSARIKR